MRKEIGIIGLGKMGGNIARRLAKKGWHVVAFNRTESVTRAFEKNGIDGAYSLESFVKKLTKPRVVLTVLTAGAPTDLVIDALLPYLEKGDIVAEGANSYYTDTERRAKKILKRNINFIDVGISGGPGGALNGACLMVGGDKATFSYLTPLFSAMAKPGAIMHFPGMGAGHFVKMVHNGIEYGMMQSIAEGFALLKNGPYTLSMLDITKIYNNGSVVESRLIGWLEDAFKEYGGSLAALSGAVGFTGEGEWTAKTAKEFKIPAKIIEESVRFRKKSQQTPSYTGKVLTGMRNQFGGHSIKKGKMT